MTQDRQQANRTDDQEYDNNNVFAKILRGEFPGELVYQDDLTLVMMDNTPRHNDVKPTRPAAAMKKPEVLKANANKTRAALKNNNH
ncbi:MAG: hypothetical protein WA888_19635 [Burkholderiaceae bacterium]